MLPPLPNLRKTTEKRTRWWTQMAGLGLWSLLQPLCMSLNIRSIKEEHDDVYTTPFLVALWHNRTVVPGYAWHLAHKPLNMCVLTSASKDGALVEAVCKYFGLEAVRGSSGRRGAIAYMEMLRKSGRETSAFVSLRTDRVGPCTKCSRASSGWPRKRVCLLSPSA